MSEDFLKNPLSLFDVRGKTAIVTGATGAFGALAAKVLAGAGANVVLAAGGAEALKKVAAECEQLGAKVEAVNMRPSSEANCDEIVEAAVEAIRRRRHPGVSRPARTRCRRSSIRRPRHFLDVMDANVTQSWLMARAAGRQMLAQGRGGKVILMSSARGLLGHPAGYTAYCASKSAIDGITKALGCEWGDTGITVNASGRPCSARRSPPGCTRTPSARGRCARASCRARAERPPRRAVRPRRPAPVPRLEGVGFLHRPHPLCRWRLHGGLERWLASKARRIAVVGAGLMGHGIAQVFALAGHDVTITDSLVPNLDTVKARIAANLRDLGDDETAVERVGRAPISPTPCATPTTWSRRCRKTCR